ncbi:Outer membrane protein TolC [Flagellimonas taeanensis]|uniref:Outer membrane protein TolC n=1 Tax=Flagellimonas taeanensis TaxID=1005926 RepID=A0A1M7BD23_9FLAO|nr:TolC family protein [Allomuricauda taeanensis]SFC39607.1 Outer membrane protein TolC [Allomuricauda taeanensis]SHL52824.1 Outer membrane protein TolC [Allomuricauda taeanensis]
MRYFVCMVFLFGLVHHSCAQERSLGFFVTNAEENAPGLLENANLQKVGELQDEIIRAQNNAFQINATSEVLVAPYFNSNDKFLDVTTNPSVNALGYDVGITNGGLYSAQVNITKNIFNKTIVDNLLLQNQLSNASLALGQEEMTRNLVKNITDLYIFTYQLQLQKDFTLGIIEDLNNRLKVMELLVKRGILAESDYLAIQSDIGTKQLELDQIDINFKNLYTQMGNLSGVSLTNFDPLAEPQIETTPQKDTLLFEKRFALDSLQISADQNVFENQYRPQVSMYGNSGLNAVDLNNLQRRFGLSAGLRLTIPIYDGQQKKYNELQNKLKLDNLDFYKKYNETQAQNTLESLQMQMDGQTAYLKQMEQQLQLQSNILDIYKQKMVQGLASVIDYLNLVQTYKLTAYAKLQAQTNLWLLRNQYNYTNW